MRHSCSSWKAGQDPIRLSGNNPNLYAYVEDPNTYIDPFGLAKICGDNTNNTGFVAYTKRKTNRREGTRREQTMKRVLEDIYGKDRVIPERLLYDKNGNKITGKDGIGRRIDFIILDEKGQPMRSIEVTSKGANKKKQESKEIEIRDEGEKNGGTFIKNAEGDLVQLPRNLETEIIRMK